MTEMWYYTCEGKQMDPVTIKELRRLVGDGVLKPTDMVWKDGMARWIRASSMKELFPDPASSLDQFFTNTSKEVEKPGGKASVVTPTALTAAAGTTSPSTGGKRSGPPADDEPQQKKKRRPADDDGDDLPRRRSQGTGGGASFGIIIALLLGGGVLLAALVVGVIILIAVRPTPAAPLNPNNLIKGEVKYNLALAPTTRDSRKFSFRRGVDYELLVKTQPQGPNTDVDIHVFNSNGIEMAKEDMPDSNCSLRWTPDADGEYTVEVVNLDQFGRAVPVTCNVLIREFKDQPIADKKEPPKEPPLPADVLTGNGNLKLPLLTPGKEHVFKLQVKAGHGANIRLQTLGAKKGDTDFDLYVLKDSDGTQIVADTGPSPHASVNFTLPATEIVRVRVHNNSKTASHLGTVYYDVAPVGAVQGK